MLCAEEIRGGGRRELEARPAWALDSTDDDTATYYHERYTTDGTMTESRNTTVTFYLILYTPLNLPY